MEILQQLWYGGLHPIEQLPYNQQEMKEIYAEIEKLEEQMNTMLNQKEQEIWKQYMDEQLNMTALSECNGFVQGFRLGARMMIEALYTERPGGC